tara:strand:+ start:286 stop:558 length:273 start_codon:yes stop_codon:yes gene_type:complete
VGSDKQDTQDESTWSDQDREDGQPTERTTTRSVSNRSGNIYRNVTPEVVSYVTSVAGETPDEDDIREFIEGLELWYSDARQGGDFSDDNK